MQENVPIEHDLVTKAIENAQTRVEGHNFDLRKHVVEYDDVVNKQRAIIYSERHKVLSDEDLRSIILKMADEVIDELVTMHTAGNDTADWDLETLANSIAALMPTPPEFSPDSLAPLSRDELNEYLKSISNWAYETREVELGVDMMRQAEKLVLLNVIDRNWVGHLTAIDELRQGIGLRAYGQRDPLVEYKSEAFNMFQGLLAGIRQEVVHAIFHVALQQAPAPPTKPPAVHKRLRKRGRQVDSRQEDWPQSALPLRQRKEVQAMPRAPTTVMNLSFAWEPRQAWRANGIQFAVLATSLGWHGVLVRGRPTGSVESSYRI